MMKTSLSSRPHGSFLVILLLVLNYFCLVVVHGIAVVQEPPLRQTKPSFGARVETYDPVLRATLGTQNFHVISNLVDDPAVLRDCSQQAASVFERYGGDDGVYLNKPWKSSRIYIDGGTLWTPKEKEGNAAVFMEPMIHQVRKTLAPRLGLVPDGCQNSELLEEAMPLEAAFCNYYIGVVGDEDTPRDMSNHIDCNSKSVPVPLSCVVQGIYDDPGGSSSETTATKRNFGNENSQVLGILDCQDRKKDFPVEPVSLTAGDALVLAGAWHQPRPVPDGVKRLVFVFFFSELNFVS